MKAGLARESHGATRVIANALHWPISLVVDMPGKEPTNNGLIKSICPVVMPRQLKRILSSSTEVLSRLAVEILQILRHPGDHNF